MKNKHALRQFAAVCIVVWVIVISCAKENEENLSQNNTPATCDTTNSTFAAVVHPIIQQNCYSCHGNGKTEGGMNLDGYQRIKVQVNNGNLLNVIRHTPGYSAMPYGLPKLAQCDINKIAAWVNRGALNN